MSEQAPGQGITDAPENDTEQRIIIVSGMSGAGRSSALKGLEDLGWFAVDNLPPQMIRPLIELAAKARDALPKLAVAMDIRGGRLLNQFEAFVVELRQTHEVTVLFLDATDHALVRRYESSRRPHPLQREDGDTILEAIHRERERLSEIRSLADIVIDTSELNVNEFARRIWERFGEPEHDKVRMTVMSFGFKYGLPVDADLVLDMRFLPNPFWNPQLRPFNGRDKRVADYVLAQPGATQFVDSLIQMLDSVIAGYARENKRQALIAIGCTGGKHRSVAMTEYIANRLRGREDVTVAVKHRDLGRE